MAVNAPTAGGLADSEAAGGGTLTLTLTPPAAGDYDHCQVLYRQGAATAWTTGPTHTGAQGTQAAVSVTGLTAGLMTDVIAYALDATGNAGPPSVVLRGRPTTGSGPVSRRVEAHILAALEAMTIANGFPWDVDDVVLCRGPEDVRDDDGVYLYLACTDIDQKDQGSRGTQGYTTSTMKVTILASHSLTAELAAATTAAARATARSDAAHELAAEVTQAILADPTRGYLAVDTWADGQELVPKPELKVADAAIVATYRVLYRTDRQNPYQEV